MAKTPRRPKLKQSDGGSLFESVSARTPDATPVVILSSNFTIGPLLARGALLPDAIEGDAMSAVDTNLRLRWTSGRLPSQWVTSLVEAARNVIPIAIRLRPGRTVRSLVIPEGSAAVEAICLSDAEGMVFRTEKERDRFESLDFSNYDLAGAGIRLLVEPSLFEATGDDLIAEPQASQTEEPAFSAPDIGSQSGAPSSMEDAIRAVRFADCLTGLLAFLMEGSPGKKSWMLGVQRMFAKKVSGPATSWPERIASAALGLPVEASTLEIALLKAITNAVQRFPVEGGWPAEQVLTELTAAAKGHMESADQRGVADLDRWAARAADVLASRAEPVSLGDDGFVLQRAALLLLLRGDLEALAGGEAELTGPLRPGPLVRGTASALAALRTGLRAMPSRYKRGSETRASSAWLAYLGEVFVALLQTANPPALVPASLPTPSVTYRSIRTLQGEWISTIVSQEIARTSADVDRGLERLLTMGQHLGFEFKEHGDDGLVSVVTPVDGRPRPVCLELIRTDNSSGSMVRFSAPALKLMAVGARQRMTRDLAIELLKRNADPRMNCRFAINGDATEVLVLVDQLLATLDDAEFMHHIHHVAKVAEEFELSLNVGTVSAS